MESSNSFFTETDMSLEQSLVYSQTQNTVIKTTTSDTMKTHVSQSPYNLLSPNRGIDQLKAGSTLV